MRFCERLSRCWKHFWKPTCRSLFSSFIAFLMMSVVSQKAPSLPCWFQSKEHVKISWSQFRRVWGCCLVVTLFTKNSLTQIYRCAGALSWRRNQELVLYLQGRFVLTASLWRRRKQCTYIFLFTVSFPVNYTSEFRERFRRTKPWNPFFAIFSSLLLFSSTFVQISSSVSCHALSTSDTLIRWDIPKFTLISRGRRNSTFAYFSIQLR
jgi:hypothetical protein